MGLSEPRRKQRITLDPRNETWSRDQSKFGFVLMQKMGWNAGAGLGKNQDGMKEHIKLSKKDNNLGWFLAKRG
jgi:Pin2-interacting protein X1